MAFLMSIVEAIFDIGASMQFDQDETEEAAIAFGILSSAKPLPKELAARGLSGNSVRADVVSRTLLDPDVMFVASATIARKGAKA
jgi:hypothetical protein